MVGDWEHGLLSCCSDPAVCESALRLKNLKTLTCPSGLCGSLFHSCLFCQSAAALGLPWKRWLLDQKYSTLLSYFRWWVLSLCLPMFAPLRTLTREKYGWDGHKKAKAICFCSETSLNSCSPLSDTLWLEVTRKIWSLEFVVAPVLIVRYFLISNRFEDWHRLNLSWRACSRG